MDTIRFGYKKTKVGIIPIEWDVKKLGDIGNCQIGLTYSPEDVVESKGLLVLRSSNIKNGRIVYIDNVFVDKEVGERLLTKENDILICARNGSRSLIGKNALITKQSSNLCFGAFMSLYRSKYNRFLYHMFQTQLYQKQIFANLGATINQITTQNLNDFIFPMPPEEEQEKIEEILSTWDSAIEKQEQLIEKKKEFKKGLIQRLLIGEVRLKEFSDKWKYVQIKDIAISISELNKADDELTVLSCTKYDGLVESLKYFGKRMFSEDTSKYKKVWKNDFAYATNHIEEGSIGVQRVCDVGLVSPMYTVFRVDTTLVDTDYLFYLLKTDKYISIYKSSTTASVDRRGSLRWPEFSRIRLYLPSLEEQKKISEVFKTADKEIELLQKELVALKLQKKGLMQRLLTGEVRVKL